MRFRRKKKQSERGPVFSGSCFVREFTGDGRGAGRCHFATHDGICPRHGDVTHYLVNAGWPRDFELPKYDGQEWAERLRKDHAP